MKTRYEFTEWVANVVNPVRKKEGLRKITLKESEKCFYILCKFHDQWTTDKTKPLTPNEEEVKQMLDAGKMMMVATWEKGWYFFKENNEYLLTNDGGYTKMSIGPLSLWMVADGKIEWKEYNQSPEKLEKVREMLKDGEE
jgi:hypothetical protein